MARQNRHADSCRAGKHLMAYTFDRRTDARKGAPSSTQPDAEDNTRLPNRLMDSRPLTNQIMEEKYELPENDMLESVLRIMTERC